MRVAQKTLQRLQEYGAYLKGDHYGGADTQGRGVDIAGGGEGSRTPGLYDANVALYQLSHTPGRF